MGGSLQVRNLRTALRGPFTADFAPGSCTVVSGPSGIGKTLFLRMIADLDPNEGSVRLGVLDRAAVPAPRWRALVCYVTAEPGWWAPRVRDHMADHEAAATAFPALGLRPDLLDAPVAQLSTGERQRAALVRASVRNPHFLLLDEPTASLDPAATALVEADLARLKRGGTGLLIVSHGVEQVRRMADRHLVMDARSLVDVSA